MTETRTVLLDFLGGLTDCKIVSTHHRLPRKSRYICTTEGYDVYDCGEHFCAVPELNKWNK